MKKTAIIGTITINAMALIVMVGVWYQQNYIFPSNKLTASIQDAVEEKPLNNLTQDQKIGQLFMMGFDGTQSDTLTLFIKKRPLGGILLLEKNIQDEKQIQKLTSETQTIAKMYTNTSILIAIDQEGGEISRIPSIENPHTTQPKITNTENAYAVARTRGEHLLSLGINLNFSPVLDVAQNNTSFMWNRVFRGDVKFIGELGMAFVRGYTDANVISCPKHFPGHGETPQDPHIIVSTNNQSLKRIIQQSQPFADAIVSGAQCIMVGHSIGKNADSLPASQSSTVLQNWLRDAFHFTGIIITDDMEMEAARPEPVEGAHTKTQSIAQASIAALQAGVDMIIISGHTTTQQEREIIYDEISITIKNGALTQKQVDEKVSRILHLKNSND